MAHIQAYGDGVWRDVISYSDNTIGVSLNSGVTIDTNGLATENGQNTIINYLGGISIDVRPGISGPISYFDGPVDSGASVGIDIDTNGYRHLTIFGNMNKESTWQLLNKAGSEYYYDMDAYTSTNYGTSSVGLSWNFSKTWENVSSRYVGLNNSYTEEVNTNFYYTLHK